MVKYTKPNRTKVLEFHITNNRDGDTDAYITDNGIMKTSHNDTTIPAAVVVDAINHRRIIGEFSMTMLSSNHQLTNFLDEFEGPMIISYGSLVYTSMKEELTRRHDESGPFQRCKNNVSIPLEWDRANEKCVIVLILDEVSNAQLY
jgi:hypothetical protein